MIIQAILTTTHILNELSYFPRNSVFIKMIHFLQKNCTFKHEINASFTKR